MPTYTVRTANLMLDEEGRGAVALAITSAHAAATGAPAYFAQVFFEAAPPGGHFVGGRPNALPHLYLHGLIRAGRTAAQKCALLEALRDGVAGAAAVPREDVWVYVQEIAAEQMVEFGRVLPAPDGEPEWRESLSARKRAELLQAGVAI